MTLELQPRGGFGILILSVVLGLTTLFSLVIVGLVVGQRTTAAEQKASERRALVADAITYACNEIEKLKAGEREAALKGYADLNKNRRLLKIPRSAEIEKAAKESRDAKLRRYRKVPCPVQGEIR